ncbi:hypothetical protein [Leptolyngbya sp. FACHB-16]|uniref:hypothetical protein n=1 Tax=unclassified Leptolyngbya TaxID=2650499 RepID=UPI001688DF76|nr:hypothetical protein [Leptolyngbya sp. FACHB-16]MBD2155295.1 hypothetical protein [Leptolyngbya sp. FACHB-16]
MKPSLRSLSLLGLLVIPFGLMACADLQMRPQPAPPSPDAVSSPGNTASAPGAVAPSSVPVSWSQILGETSAPEGWRVEPCVNPTLLCVYEGDEIVGTVELFTEPVEGSQFGNILAEEGGQPIPALRRWIELHYETIRSDRQIGMPTTRFTSEPPEETAVGNLPGLRYGFTTTHENGALIDRSIGYMATDGTTLYVIATGMISQDPAGSFSSQEKTQQFLPHLAKIISGLNFN